MLVTCDVVAQAQHLSFPAILLVTGRGLVWPVWLGVAGRGSVSVWPVWLGVALCFTVLWLCLGGSDTSALRCRPLWLYLVHVYV